MRSVLVDTKFKNKEFILAVLTAWKTLQNDSRLSDLITQIGFAPFYGNLDQKEYLINYAVICTKSVVVDEYKKSIRILKMGR